VIRGGDKKIARAGVKERSSASSPTMPATRRASPVPRAGSEGAEHGVSDASRASDLFVAAAKALAAITST
jgi:hypothetical protein